MRMRPRDAIIDGQVTNRYGDTPAPAPVVINPPAPGNTDMTDPAIMDLQNLNYRARLISVFLKVPFLAFVALNKQVPGFIRLGCAGLAIWEASQIAAQQKDFEMLLPDQVG